MIRALALAAAIFTAPTTPTVTGTTQVAVDAPGASRCVLQVDTTRIGVDYVEPFTWAWDTTSYAPGPHTLKVNCYDPDGTAWPRAQQIETVDQSAFTATQGEATQVHLAAATTGDWTIDGSPAGSGQTLDPLLTIGDHEVTFTAGGSSSSQTVNVEWRGWPYTAQVDAFGPNPGAVDAIGPWRVLDAIPGDWLPDATDPALLHMVVHQGDHPSISGGDRVGLGLNEAYTPALDLMGNASHAARFYHIEFRLPSTNTFPLAGYNNFSEFRGGAWTTLKISPNGSGTSIRVSFTPKLLGVDQPRVIIDDHPMIPDHWEDYVLEVKLSEDPAVGYVRVWRDGVCRTCGMPQADADGRIFGATKKSDADGTVWPTTLEQQLYREPTIVPDGYMDILDTTIADHGPSAP